MKILAELSEKSLGINEHQQVVGDTFTLRKSARAIVLNSEGRMALQHIQKYNYHKLPGGGMEVGEDIEQTLFREIKEEVGCDIAIKQLLGVVIAYQRDLLHMSYGYVVTVVGELHEPAFDEGEVDANQTTLWLPPSESLDILKADLDTHGHGDFILQREIIFLNEFLSK